MKQYKKGLVFSLLICSMALASPFNAQVNASSTNSNSFKIGGDREYQEISGPHLIVNVNGLDKNGNEILNPRFVEFPLKAGDVLNKEEIIKYVEWTLDATDYNKYRVIDFASNSKVQVSYFDKVEKRDVTKEFPITDKGFIIPDLSQHITNPGFTLVTDVIIEEKTNK